ncbi:hypothetical protein WA026_004800 [Henosepilachna vigintioctopunctata]|uniref:Uncharacterized protein n=1 Tax=Henosepilachna vigintioctopunctata TaxID=420089 RepID=A0AAW1VB24_9CUCU
MKENVVALLKSSFNEELAESSLDNIFFLRNIDEKVAYLSEVLTRLFNKHELMRTCRITKPPAPWITDDLNELMIIRDKSKRRFRKSHTEAKCKNYQVLSNSTTTAIRNDIFLLRWAFVTPRIYGSI